MASSGFLRAYEAAMAKYTDAPDVFHTASAYAVMGALCTRYKYRCVLDTGVPPRWSNLWVILVGDSGDSRKSTALNMANEVLTRVDSELIAPTDGSTEGFISYLHKRNLASKNNACGVLVSSEFSNLLSLFQRGYSAQLKTWLMDIYDVPSQFKRSLAKSEFIIPRPRMSMLGAIATELLPSMTIPEDWLGGFFSRCILVPAVRTRLLENPSSPPESEYVKHSHALWVLLKKWRVAQLASGRKPLRYNDAALKVVKELPAIPDEPNLKMTLSRASVHLMKTAAMEQIDEDPEAVEIGKAATERALKFVRYWHEKLPDLIDECFARGREDFEGDRLPKRIYRYLVKRVGIGKPVPYSEVMRSVALSSDHMRRAVMSLMEAGMVEQRSDEDATDETDTLVLVAKPLKKMS